MNSFNPSQILLEDNHLIVINKLPGQLSQGDKTGDSSLIDDLKAYLVKTYNKPGEAYLGSIHRLDRPTSGILIFAKTSKALTRMNKLIKDKQLTKSYWAVVNSIPEPKTGTLEDYLAKNSRLNKSFIAHENQPGAKLAKLNYRYIKSLDNYHLLEIELITGRHHQIRAQLANQKVMIKGDLKYGFKRPNKDKSIHLHARKIEFMHPVKKEPISIIAIPPPDPIWNACVPMLDE